MLNEDLPRHCCDLVSAGCDQEPLRPFPRPRVTSQSCSSWRTPFLSWRIEINSLNLTLWTPPQTATLLALHSVWCQKQWRLSLPLLPSPKIWPTTVALRGWSGLGVTGKGQQDRWIESLSIWFVWGESNLTDTFAGWSGSLSPSFWKPLAHHVYSFRELL